MALETGDYQEPACPFDTGGWVKRADSAAAVIPVREILAELDALYDADRGAEGGALLERWRAKAADAGDWSGEVTMLSELMGHYRKTGDRDKGLAAVEDGLALLRAHGLAATVSGATVALNAATTLKAFGEAARAVPIFTAVCRVYADHLDPADYRFAGLYNNMALACQDVGDGAAAERYFERALAILRKGGGRRDEEAVTWCNLAALYAAGAADDPRIDEALAAAWDALDDAATEQNGYHAFNLTKCAPAFRRFGYETMAAELEEKARRIYDARH